MSQNWIINASLQVIRKSESFTTQEINDDSIFTSSSDRFAQIIDLGNHYYVTVANYMTYSCSVKGGS